MKWREGEWTMTVANEPGYRTGLCHLCERLWEPIRTPKTVNLLPFC